jgi:hypothetical protein
MRNVQLKVIRILSSFSALVILSFPFVLIWCGWILTCKVLLTGLIAHYILNKAGDTLREFMQNKGKGKPK